MLEEWKELKGMVGPFPWYQPSESYDLAMQALEKTEEALRVAIGPLEMMQEKFKDMGAKDYSILAESLKNAFKGVLKKHGFEEEIE